MRRRQKRFDKNLAIGVALGAIAFGLTQIFSLQASGLSYGFKIILLIVIGACIAGASLGAILWVYRFTTARQRSQNFAALHAHDVDNMTGKEFEIFLKHLLMARGFTVKNVWHGNDGGVDLVAKIGEKTYSIQAKRYNARRKADRRAVTDAVAGIQYRDCTHAMAITNSYFTKAAAEYAKKTGCKLVDRDLLAGWIGALGE